MNLVTIRFIEVPGWDNQLSTVQQRQCASRDGYRHRYPPRTVVAWDVRFWVAQREVSKIGHNGAHERQLEQIVGVRPALAAGPHHVQIIS